MKKILAFFFLMLEETAYARGGVGEILFFGAIGFIVLMLIIAVQHFAKKEYKDSVDTGVTALKMAMYLGGFVAFIWSLGTSYGLWVVGGLVLLNFLLKKKDDTVKKEEEKN